MRDTIIIIFSAVVLIVSLMAFALMRLTVGDTTRRGATAANPPNAVPAASTGQDSESTGGSGGTSAS